MQDKLLQKQTLAAAGLPVTRFVAVGSAVAIGEAGHDFGWPMLLKARRNAYDGKGNVTVGAPGELDAAWARLGGDRGRSLYLEEFCPFATELAVVVVRGRDGETLTYPVVETLQRDHVCNLVLAPAPVPPEIAERAAALARAAVAAVGGVGSFGVEMFLTHAGEVVINELAPRVHNSGHYTIEACVYGLEQALAVPGAHVHIYGKAMTGPGRKMGHVTALGQTLDEARATAQRAAALIRFGGAGR